MVRPAANDPNRWFFYFDAASPSGKGGASVLLDPALGLASIDGVGRNKKLPRRSTGRLLAEGLCQIGMPKPAVLEAYNVEATTHIALAAGGVGQGTLLGNMLADTARALGGTIVRWEPVAVGSCYHLRIHLDYP